MKEQQEKVRPGRAWVSLGESGQSALATGFLLDLVIRLRCPLVPGVSVGGGEVAIESHKSSQGQTQDRAAKVLPVKDSSRSLQTLARGKPQHSPLGNVHREVTQRLFFFCCFFYRGPWHTWPLRKESLQPQSLIKQESVWSAANAMMSTRILWCLICRWDQQIKRRCENERSDSVSGFARDVCSARARSRVSVYSAFTSSWL